MLAALLCAAAIAADKPEPPKASTALPGVSLLGAPLEMPGLERKRQLRLYLPPGYAASSKRYPVLYMYGGQNLFDVVTAYAGEWKVVKPMIDQNYRTLPGREHTAIMGSSMGGPASHYALVQYPEVLSKAGAFSPAYWTAKPAFDFVAPKPAPQDARVFMLMGEKDGPEMNGDVKRMAELVKKTGHPPANTVLRIVPGAEHNEAFWAGELRAALLCMFAPDKT